VSSKYDWRGMERQYGYLLLISPRQQASFTTEATEYAEFGVKKSLSRRALCLRGRTKEKTSWFALRLQNHLYALLFFV
jgi:hypothetical protein